MIGGGGGTELKIMDTSLLTEANSQAAIPAFQTWYSLVN
jgi:hypothetical protein